LRTPYSAGAAALALRSLPGDWGLEGGAFPCGQRSRGGQRRTRDSFSLSTWWIRRVVPEHADCLRFVSGRETASTQNSSTARHRDLFDPALRQGYVRGISSRAAPEFSTILPQIRVRSTPAGGGARGSCRVVLGALIARLRRTLYAAHEGIGIGVADQLRQGGNPT